MKDPIVLVPAAGKGQRFRDQGFEEIKPLIRFPIGGVHTMSMLSHALWGTQGWQKIIGLPESRFTSVGPVDHDGSMLYHDGATYLSVKPNGGQLDTVWALTEHCPLYQPVMILNSDVSFRGGVLKTLHWLCSKYETNFGALVVERNLEYGMSYSFVDDAPFFRQAAERKYLSPWALAGAYWFANVRMLRRAIEIAKIAPPSYGEEHYLSEVFQWIGRGFALPVRDEDYLEFGTPELLKATIERFK